MILDAIEGGWPREDAEKCYAIFTSDYGNGKEHIQKIDFMDVFEDDNEAAEQAERDGIKVIHDSDETKIYRDWSESKWNILVKM